LDQVIAKSNRWLYQLKTEFGWREDGMALKNDDLVPICRTEEIAPGAMQKFQPPGCETIAVYNVDGTFYATSDTCTHGQASLTEEGMLEGFVVECGWHFGAFDVRSGEPMASPCHIRLATYPVEVREGVIYVELADPADGQS
jgi:p-cumate 2,3-dioxygenase ferredoxin subunit